MQEEKSQGAHNCNHCVTLIWLSAKYNHPSGTEIDKSLELNLMQLLEKSQMSAPKGLVIPIHLSSFSL